MTRCPLVSLAAVATIAIGASATRDDVALVARILGSAARFIVAAVISEAGDGLKRVANSIVGGGE